MTRLQAITAALGIALAFCAMTIFHLDAQGAYYDELHQAPAAFSYVGKHPAMFAWTYFDLPSLNMSYSGAIKSAIYGLVLKYVHPHFSVYSWRLLGIVLAAAGVFGFCWIAGPLIPTTGVLAFAALLITDITTIVLTRHDWGPVALALALRLLFLGTWLSIELKQPASYKYAVAGFIIGLAIFEKLSSVVMLVPFLILLRGSRSQRAWMAAIAGMLIGAVPLIRANMHTYRVSGTLVSFSDVAGHAPIHAQAIASYAFQYLSLGAGELARSAVLGEGTNSFFVTAEAGVMTALLLVIAAAVLHLPAHRLLHLAGVMTISYALIWIAILLLPRPTYFHHWIIGTPFQYCAIALAAPALDAMSKQKIRHAAKYRVILLASVGTLIVLRLSNVATAEVSLVSGKGSPGFDPGFSQLVEIARAQSKNAFFIAADWGTATQIYCGSDGEEDTVDEPFWSAEPAVAALQMAGKTKKPIVYVVRSGLPQPWAEVSKTILAAIKHSPDWQEIPLDNNFGKLGPIEIHKFQRASK